MRIAQIGRQYSCAYFEHPDQSLDDAQAAKKRHLTAKLLVKPGARVLDIGIGSQMVKANVYGDDHGPVKAGPVALEPSGDMIVTVTPGSPAERAAPLDVAIDTVSLVYKSPQP